jgi:hypothetical protein
MSEYENNIAYRESSQIVSTDEYFKARPQIDNHDRRKVFESGFERGWEASKKHYEAAPTPESITIPIAEYEAMKKDGERLDWCAKNSAMPMMIDTWGLWCIDFSANGGKSWYDYKQSECSATMRKAIDKAMEI